MKKMIFILFAALMLAACSSDDDSIGIIGGADGPTSIIVGEGVEQTVFDEMPEIEGLPALPGEYSEASYVSGMYMLKTSGVTEEMLNDYTKTLESEGFEPADNKDSENISSISRENNDLTVILTLADGILTAMVWIK